MHPQECWNNGNSTINPSYLVQVHSLPRLHIHDTSQYSHCESWCPESVGDWWSKRNIFETRWIYNFMTVLTREKSISNRQPYFKHFSWNLCFHSEHVLNVLCYKRILHSFRYACYVYTLYTIYNWLIILFFCHTYTLPFRRSYTISVQSFFEI